MPKTPRRSKPPDWPHLDLVFSGEGPEEIRDETDAFFHSPVIPREGETITLDGDFQRCGSFIVDHVDYTFCCDGRQNGWAKDLGVVVRLFVRRKEGRGLAI